jgi:hypothetical protein
MALLLLLIGLIRAGVPPSGFHEKQVFMGCFHVPPVNAHFVHYRPGGILSLNFSAQIPLNYQIVLSFLS